MDWFETWQIWHISTSMFSIFWDMPDSAWTYLLEFAIWLILIFTFVVSVVLLVSYGFLAILFVLALLKDFFTWLLERYEENKE